MNSFERHAAAEPSWQEYVAREEARANFDERWARERESRMEYERENSVETPEFRRAARPARMQMELFTEVA
jgi:hypothetical protein